MRVIAKRIMTNPMHSQEHAAIQSAAPNAACLQYWRSSVRADGLPSGSQALRHRASLPQARRGPSDVHAGSEFGQIAQPIPDGIAECDVVDCSHGGKIRDVGLVYEFPGRAAIQPHKSLDHCAEPYCANHVRIEVLARLSADDHCRGRLSRTEGHSSRDQSGNAPGWIGFEM